MLLILQAATCRATLPLDILFIMPPALSLSRLYHAHALHGDMPYAAGYIGRCLLPQKYLDAARDGGARLDDAISRIFTSYELIFITF